MRERVARSVRLGIIGCGHFGSYHAAAFRQLAGVHLAAFCNRTRGRAEQLAVACGGGLVTTDPDEVFAAGVDGVVIATHHDSHADLCRRAVRAGKHVLVEKPLGMSLNECDELVQSVAGHERLIHVGYKHRFAPAIERARRLLPSPDLIVGKYIDDRWDPAWWASDPKVGGGSVLSGACHTLDMLCYLAGARPVRVYAEGSGAPCLEHLYAVVTFDNGATGVCVQSQTATPIRAGKQSYSLTSRAGAAIELYNGLQSGTYRIGARTEELDRAGDEAIHQQARAFVAQIRGEAPPACSLADGYRANLLLEACFESVRRQMAVGISWSRRHPAIATT
jgi:predicted dehydrogenase